jgi:uncharacterized paraquat-inducible protein A
MRCKNCDSNFRTINIPQGKKIICYKCGHDNGVKQTPEGETDE